MLELVCGDVYNLVESGMAVVDASQGPDAQGDCPKCRRVGCVQAHRDLKATNDGGA